MRKYLFISIVTLGLVNCELRELELQTNTNLLVVEGWLLDTLTQQEVKLSISAPFESTSNPSAVLNATVKVESQDGMSYLFSHMGNGSYKSLDLIKAESSKSYRVVIDLADRTVFSDWEHLTSTPPIQSVDYQVNANRQSIVPGDLLFPIVTLVDPAQEHNFYWWRLFRNDTAFSAPNEMVLLDDRFFNGNEFSNEFQAFDYRFNDSISMELFGISQAAFEHLRQLQDQLTTIGSISAIPPSTVPGNLHYANSPDIVLGYWGVSAYRVAGKKIN